MNWKRILLFACGIMLLPIVGLAVLSALSRKPSNLGVVNGRLAPCPDSPNCVSTQAADAGHRIDPIPFSGPPAAALTKIESIVATLPRATIVTATDGYLHVEFCSALFRFVDDVEFLIDADAGQIQFRSASRAGHGDLGDNRRRMEAIRAEWIRRE
ncbi:MAG TPA: DUF1499 domain-containing protein [Planctomycetaceae bacterium]